MADEPKKRKVTKSDWDKVEKFVTDEFENRSTSTFRKNHENIWKEVDRQIAMQPLTKISQSDREASWQAAVELGELSKASEIITSDVMRITFPQERTWFQPHVELDWPLGQDGRQQRNDDMARNKQAKADGLLRSLMVQQHKDFGLKSRFRLSIKESLHHGGFVSEIRFDREMMVKEGSKIREIGAPVWVPYSMWNAYPDPSPFIIGTNLFYTGSMILVEYVPKAKLKDMAKGDGWMPDRLSKLPDEEHTDKDNKTKDIKLLKFYGDICIERSDGDIYLPNSKVIIGNGKLIYYAPNDLPYSPIIYGGYERQDVRDPYYTSPIIKQSPIQKFTTLMTNEFIDATKLKVKPPIEYDGMDPEYAANDGPVISPGSKNARRGGGKPFTTLDIGDPSFALQAMQFGFRTMQEGMGVSAIRSGVANSDRQTATEIQKTAQGAEVRTIEFVSVTEPHLLSFLYMQHELNRMYMGEYTFYSDEMHTPDFIRATKKDIDANAVFEVVGSRGLLGEEQRTQKIMAVHAWASSNPLYAKYLKPVEIILDAYRDAGKKNPEDWVQSGQPEIPQEIQLKLQQLAQENQQLKQILQENNIDMQKQQIKVAADLQKTQMKEGNKYRIHQDNVQKDVALSMATLSADEERARLEASTRTTNQQMANAARIAQSIIGKSDSGMPQ